MTLNPKMTNINNLEAVMASADGWKLGSHTLLYLLDNTST